MPQYCCVPGCGLFSGHRFPRDQDLRLKWRVAIRRTDERTKSLWSPGPNDVVCHTHFKVDDYKVTESGWLKFYQN